MKIIAITIILPIIIALHSHQATHTLLQSQNKHSIVDTKSLYFQDEFTDLETKLDYISRALKSKDSVKYKFLITKTSEIQTALSQLQDSLQAQNLLVSQSSKQCPGVTTFNRTLLRKQIVSIQQSQSAAVDSLATCKDCSFISNDFLQLQNISKRYIKHLNQTLDGMYCDFDKTLSETPKGLVNLNNSYFKPNLQAVNWYYGSTTVSDYKIYIFKRSASYNLTNCPIETPFVKDYQQVCFDCPDGSVFNLGTQQCDSCKPNQILNIQSGTCDSCIGEKIFKNGSLVCRPCVLASGQLFNETNQKCYKCGGESYLDTGKLICVKINCDANTPRFDRATNKCQPCGTSQTVDPNDVTKCIKTNFVGLCPPSTPLYDVKSKKCIECPTNKTYSRSANQCVESANTQTHTLRLVS